MSLGAALRRRGFVDDNGTPGEPTDDVFVPASAVAELATALGRATTYAFRHGTTVITSAGNNASDRDHDSDVLLLPSDSPHVISISATGPLGWGVNPSTSLDVPAFYTNFGQSAVDFAAPGGNVDFDLLFGGRDCTVAGLTAPCWAFDLVLSTGSGGTWFWAAGTSMSAAYASGTAAIIIGRAGGSLRPAMAAAALAASADDLGKRGDDGFYGAGRVNAGTAASQRP